jgi:hypothetical protein
MGDFDTIDELMLRTAQAVRAVQVRLDERLLRKDRLPAAAFSPASYAIPRASLEVEFAVEESSTRKIMLFFRGKTRRQLLTHSLRMTLDAVPFAPPVPRAEAAAFELLLPHFLVAWSDVQDISRALAGQLRAGNCDFFPPAGKEFAEQNIKKEAKRIDESLANPAPGRGMVVFRLSDPPGTYLIVRVTEKAKKDGLFVWQPESAAPVGVYSFEDDDVEPVRYAPLHDLARTLRRWVEGAAPVRISAAPEAFGRLRLTGIVQFLEGVSRGFATTLNFLASNAVSADPPAFFTLAELSARLRFSFFVGANEQGDFDFSAPRRPDGSPAEEDEALIRSEAEIRGIVAAGSPRLKITLLTPEFILRGAARQLLTRALGEEQISRTIGDTMSDAGDASPQDYQRILRAPEFERGAVILLAYKDATPEEKFLVIWPGEFKGQGRDFVFTCERKDGEMRSFKPVMRLRQSLNRVQLSTSTESGADLSEDQYKPFHNMFHAARIWQARLAG